MHAPPARVRCGVPVLNEYFTRFARQNHEMGGAKAFGAVPISDSARVLGYSTLSPASLAYDRVPSEVRAARWYARLRALRVLDAPQTLVLPLATIARALQA